VLRAREAWLQASMAEASQRSNGTRKSWALGQRSSTGACAAWGEGYSVGRGWCGDYGGLTRKLWAEVAATADRRN
jgi:hypothetical protein